MFKHFSKILNISIQAAEARRIKFEAVQKIFLEDQGEKAAEVRARKSAVGNQTGEEIECYNYSYESNRNKK